MCADNKVSAKTKLDDDSPMCADMDTHTHTHAHMVPDIEEDR